MAFRAPVCRTAEDLKIFQETALGRSIRSNTHISLENMKRLLCFLAIIVVSILATCAVGWAGSRTTLYGHVVESLLLLAFVGLFLRVVQVYTTVQTCHKLMEQPCTG